MNKTERNRYYELVCRLRDIVEGEMLCDWGVFNENISDSLDKVKEALFVLVIKWDQTDTCSRNKALCDLANQYI